jgi:hypothetical protein
MTRVSFLLALSALCLTTARAQSPATDSGVQLRWKFEPGMQVAVKVSQQMSMEMNVAGNPIDVNNTSRQVMDWTVREVNAEGIATIASSIRRVQMTLTQPNQGEISYDSQSEEEPTGVAAQLASGVKPLIGVTFTQKMKPSGEVYNVQMPQEALAAMQQGPLGQMGMSGDFIKDLTEKASPEFPAKPLKIGDSWSTQATTKSPAGDMTITNTYTYNGLQKDTSDVHRIGVKMEMKLAGDGPQGAQIRVAKQNNNGMLLFDNAAGRLLKSELDQDMTLEISVAGQTVQQKLQQLLEVDFEKQ